MGGGPSRSPRRRNTATLATVATRPSNKQRSRGKSGVNKVHDDGPEEGLPSLTPKQLAFVRALLGGKTASDAYREAYNCEGMAANSIWVAASRLRSDAKVALWLRRYQLAALQEGTVTLETHLGQPCTITHNVKRKNGH